MALFIALFVLGLYVHVEALGFLACIPIWFFFMIWVGRSIIRQVEYVRRCTHIAVAQTGVYVDCVSAPGSRIHMCRSIFLYEDYDSCYLEEGRFSNYFGYHVEFRVMLKKKNHSDPPVVLAWGVLASQLFAEKVQAMIEQVAEQKKHSLPIAASQV
jgi:hypothetical protein